MVRCATWYIVMFALGVLPSGFVAGCSADSKAGGGPAASHAPDVIAAELRQMLDERARSEAFSGVVLVARGERALFWRCAGMANIEWDLPVRRESTFEIGSLTKQFTGALAVALAEKGMLALSDRLDRLVPELLGTPIGSVTLEQLLSHTGGVPSNAEIWTLANDRTKAYKAEILLEKVRAWPLEFPPGERFAYSNVGFVLARVAIERAGGDRYEALLHKHVLGPLGMAHTGLAAETATQRYRASGYVRGFDGTLRPAVRVNLEWLPGAAGLYSTADDLVRWTRAWHGTAVMSADGIKQFLRPRRQNYALGIGVKTRTIDGRDLTVVQHTGRLGGFEAHLRNVVEDDLTIVVLNNTDTEADASGLAEAVMQSWYRQPVTPARTPIGLALARAHRVGGTRAMEQLFSQVCSSRALDNDDQEQINSLGYYFLNSDDVAAAVATLSLNVQAFPESGNAHDSLGEALLRAGERDRAIASYERAFELDPKNLQAREIVERLKAERR